MADASISSLDQLKKFTTVVADTSDFERELTIFNTYRKHVQSRVFCSSSFCHLFEYRIYLKNHFLLLKRFQKLH